MEGSTGAITNHDSSMGKAIDDAFSEAESVDIIVSFLKDSGLSIIHDSLISALKRGVKVRILTGTYLGITSPFALEQMLGLGENAEVRLFSDEGISFHPKAYIIRTADPNSDRILIGSSNLSRSALTDGVEWNYNLKRSMDPASFSSFEREFEYLYGEHSVLLTPEIVREYRDSWVKPAARILPKHSETMSPEGPQIPALFALKHTREEGMDKALIVAATGVGKTFIAACDSQSFERILFVAHRREILEQAEKTFRQFHPGKTTGFLYSGHRDTGADLLFASVQSLRQENILGKIAPDRFDYIVIDEFHHAAAGSYSRILEHFKPKFLLGLTATPERMDARDVFVLCDYNVVYEIGMSDAIRFGRLVPFHYYGIADNTDYTELRYSNGRYNGDDLDAALINEARAELIYRHYMKYPSERAVGFCSGIRHAEFMKSFFMRKGIESRAVVSGGDDDRSLSVSDFEDGKVSVLFTVDMFNEGVDIPSIDTVMFLRPTESRTVFIQQLGRGLRKSEDKTHLTVLDFIGNYRKADMIPSLLTGVENISLDSRAISAHAPCGCVIDFDLESIDIMERVAERNRAIKDTIDSEFRRITAELGHVPTRMEFFTNLDETLCGRMNTVRDRVFRDYLGYLSKNELATPIETAFTSGIAGEFIRFVETTAMNRLYKMPLLLSFFRNGVMHPTASDDDIIQSFRTFYSNPSNRPDISGLKGLGPYEKISDSKWLKLARENPIHFIMKSGGEKFFSYKDGEFSFSEEMRQFIPMKVFSNHVLDAVNYRVAEFRRSRYISKQ